MSSIGATSDPIRPGVPLAAYNLFTNVENNLPNPSGVKSSGGSSRIRSIPASEPLPTQPPKTSLGTVSHRGIRPPGGLFTSASSSLADMIKFPPRSGIFHFGADTTGIGNTTASAMFKGGEVPQLSVEGATSPSPSPFSPGKTAPSVAKSRIHRRRRLPEWAIDFGSDNTAMQLELDVSEISAVHDENSRGADRDMDFQDDPAHLSTGSAHGTGAAFSPGQAVRASESRKPIVRSSVKRSPGPLASGASSSGSGGAGGLGAASSAPSSSPSQPSAGSGAQWSRKTVNRVPAVAPAAAAAALAAPPYTEPVWVPSSAAASGSAALPAVVHSTILTGSKAPPPSNTTTTASAMLSSVSAAANFSTIADGSVHTTTGNGGSSSSSSTAGADRSGLAPSVSTTHIPTFAQQQQRPTTAPVRQTSPPDVFGIGTRGPSPPVFDISTYRVDSPQFFSRGVALEMSTPPSAPPSTAKGDSPPAVAPVLSSSNVRSATTRDSDGLAARLGSQGRAKSSSPTMSSSSDDVYYEKSSPAGSVPSNLVNLSAASAAAATATATDRQSADHPFTFPRFAPPPPPPDRPVGERPESSRRAAEDAHPVRDSVRNTPIVSSFEQRTPSPVTVAKTKEPLPKAATPAVDTSAQPSGLGSFSSSSDYSDRSGSEYDSGNDGEEADVVFQPETSSYPAEDVPYVREQEAAPVFTSTNAASSPSPVTPPHAAYDEAVSSSSSKLHLSEARQSAAESEPSEGEEEDEEEGSPLGGEVPPQEVLFAQALEVKESANSAYAAKDYQAAYDTYANAIVLAVQACAPYVLGPDGRSCPVKCREIAGEVLGILHGNKSAAATMLGRFHEAARDAQAGVRWGVKPAKKIQYLLRAIRCYVCVADYASASRLVDTTSKAIDDLQDDELQVQQFRKQLRDLRQAAGNLDSALAGLSMATSSVQSAARSVSYFKQTLNLLGVEDDPTVAPLILYSLMLDAQMFVPHEKPAVVAKMAALCLVHPPCSDVRPKTSDGVVDGSLETLYLKARVYSHYEGEPEKAIAALDTVEKASNARQILLHSQGTRTSSSLCMIGKRAKTERVIIERAHGYRKNGNLAYQEHRFSDSTAMYTSAIKTLGAPHSRFTAMLLGNRAASLKASGAIDDALTSAHDAVAADRTFSKSYLRRARCYMALSKWSQAHDDLVEALRLDPSCRSVVEEDIADMRRKMASSSSRMYEGARDKYRAYGDRSGASSFEQSYRAYTSGMPGGPGGASERFQRRTNSQYYSGNAAGAGAYSRSRASTASAPKGPDAYAILGIKREKHLTDKEVKTAYRAMCLQYHPDKWVGKSEEDAQGAAEKFKKVQNAFECIKCEDMRRKYDLEHRLFHRYNGF